MNLEAALGWRPIDWVCVLGFFLIALKFQLSLLYEADFTVIPNSDSGAVVAFLSGWLHEGRYVGDMILDDRSKFLFYLTLVMPAVAVIDWFVDDLGRSYLLTMLPIVFAQALGFYLVGRRFLHGRVAAAIFAVVTLTPVWTMDGDLWGIHHTPLIRMAFSAVFPYLMLLALNVERNLRGLYLLAACCGVALYVHGVSGPSVTFGLFLGTLAFVRGRAQFAEWVRKCFVSVVVFVVLVAPFAIVYLGSFPGLEGTPTDGVADVLANYGAYEDLGEALRSMLGPACCNAQIGHGWHWFVWIGGLLGIVAACVTRSARSHHVFLLLFVAGIVFASVGVTALDQWVNDLLGKPPTQVDLIRNVRFLVPILILGYGLLFQTLIDSIRKATAGDRRFRLLVPGLTAAFLVHAGVFMVPQFNATAPGYVSPHFDSGARLTARLTPPDVQALLAFLKAEPANTSIFPVTDDVVSLAIRYQSLQPVTYVYKDRNALLYSNHPDTRRFLNIRENYDTFLVTDDLTLAEHALCNALALAPSDLLVLDHRLVSKGKLSLVSHIGTLSRSFVGASVFEVKQTSCV